MNTDNFIFNPKGHSYTLDGKKLTGVTTILGVIAKELTQWASNMAVDYVINNSEKAVNQVAFIVTEQTLEDARKAWITVRDKAGDSGKDIHSIVEGIVKRAIALDGHISPVEAHEYADNPQVTNFINWATTSNIRFLESEKSVYSRTNWCAGTLDIVCEKDGEVYLADVKTAKSIYPTNYWQMSAYQMMLQEMGLYSKVKGFIVVRLGKDGTFEVGENYSYDDNIQGFLSALTIYRKLNAITPPKKYKTK